MSATGFQPDRAEHTVEETIGRQIKREVKRFGYLVAATVNVIMLWIAHQLLDWEWPGFLTSEFDDVLPIITVSFVASIAANLVYAWNDNWPIKTLGELVTTVIGLVAAIRIWQVFPFEFTGTDWSWLIRVVLLATVLGTVLGTLAQLVSLVKGPPTQERTDKPVGP